MTETPTFGDALDRLVRRRGWTMSELAQHVGCTPSTLSRLRTGKRLPRSEDLERWITVLALDEEEARGLRDAALLAHAPEALRQRLAQAEADAQAERERRSNLEHHYAEYRREQNFYDGLWLAYHRSFLNDGSVTRSLAHVSGDAVTWLNMEADQVHYSYIGAARVLGDKIFVLMEEDRGGAEFVQVTLNALFDFRRPTFLYGIVTGVSGKTIRHPVSCPAAARMVMVYAGGQDELGRDPDRMTRITALLGSHDDHALRPLVPEFLGTGDLLRRCLELRPREDLDAVLLGMLDNRLQDGEHALTAAFR